MFSASPMLRTVFSILVLATFAVTTAAAAPVRHAKAHPKASHRNLHPAAKHPSEHPKAAPHPRAQHAVVRHRSAHPTPKHIRKHPAVYHRRYRGARLVRTSFRRTIFMASPLKGTLESLQHQNEMAESEGLERILDESDLQNRIAEKLLVPVPVSVGLMVNDNLPETHRYCRPWTADFLEALAAAHEEQFHRPLIVTSAVRTVAYQQHLMRINGNAAAAEGDIASPHLTGATIDIGKKGMSRTELNWMRSWLLRLQMEGKIDAEEEFRQACFHITVYKAYDPSLVEPAPAAPTADQSAEAGDENAGGQ